MTERKQVLAWNKLHVKAMRAECFAKIRLYSNKKSNPMVSRVVQMYLIILNVPARKPTSERMISPASHIVHTC